MIEVSYKSQNSGIQASLRLLFWLFMNKMRYLSRLRWREIEARCCCRVQTEILDIDAVHCSLCVPEIRQVRVCVSINKQRNAPRGHICLLLDLDGALSHPLLRRHLEKDQLRAARLHERSALVLISWWGALENPSVFLLLMDSLCVISASFCFELI